MRILFSFLFVTISIAAIIGMMGAKFELFVDFPSLMVVVFFSFIYQFLLFGIKNTKTAFTSPFRNDKSAKDLAMALAYFKAFGKSAWLFGIIAFCLSTMVVLLDVTSLERLGPFMSISIISMLYAAEVNLLLVTPYIACIRQAQAKVL